MGLLSRRRERLAHLVASEVAKLASADEIKASVPGLGPLPPGARTVDATAIVNNLSQPSGAVSPDAANALPRLDPPVPFGPGFPVFPASIDPRLRRSGRTPPRLSEYPVSWNLPGQGQPHVPFTVLRDFADNVNIARLAIEIRKAQLVELDWSITIRPEAIESIMASTGERSISAAKMAREKFSDEINRLKAWFEKPDRINNLSFDEWISMLMEEQLVIDAVAIYPHLNLKGDLHSLELVDGATIKPLLDHRGAVPQPPNPAYQQLLYGFARGEFQASLDPDDEYRTDQLIYKRRYLRTTSPYGMSPTEQSLVTGDLYLKRMEWMRAEYSAGVVPELIIQTDADLTPDQLQWYEEVFNEELAGNTDRRHRARFLPRGMTPASMSNFAERYTSEYDEHLIKIMLAHYGVSPMEIGLVPARAGLGGKGLSEGQEDAGERKKRQTVVWLCDVLNDIAINWLKMPRELTFHALGGEIDDQAALAQTRDLQLKDGTRTLNDLRAEMGMPLYDFPEADMPFMVTGTGVVFMEGSSKTIGVGAPPVPPAPGAPPPPKEASDVQPQGSQEEDQPGGGSAPGTDNGEPAAQDGAARPQGGTPARPAAPAQGRPSPSRPGFGTKTAEASVETTQAELRAFTTFVSKRAKGRKAWRDFNFNAVAEGAATLLNTYGATGDMDSVKALSDGILDGLVEKDVSDEQRDERGRWTAGGGESGGDHHPMTGSNGSIKWRHPYNNGGLKGDTIDRADLPDGSSVSLDIQTGASGTGANWPEDYAAERTSWTHTSEPGGSAGPTGTSTAGGFATAAAARTDFESRFGAVRSGAAEHTGVSGKSKALSADKPGHRIGAEKSATLSKDEAGYRVATDPDECCGTCSMFRGSHCTLVEGTIGAEDVCDHWDPSGAEKVAHDVSGEARDHGRFAVTPGGGGSKIPAKRGTKKPAAKPAAGDDQAEAPAKKPDPTASRTAPDKPVGKPLDPAERAQHLARITGQAHAATEPWTPPKNFAEFQAMVRQATAEPMLTHHMMAKRYTDEAVKIKTQETEARVHAVRNEQNREDVRRDVKTHAICIGVGAAVFGVLLPVLGAPVGGAVGAGVALAAQTVPGLAQEFMDFVHHGRSEDDAKLIETKG